MGSCAAPVSVYDRRIPRRLQALRRRRHGGRPFFFLPRRVSPATLPTVCRSSPERSDNSPPILLPRRRSRQGLSRWLSGLHGGCHNAPEFLLKSHEFFQPNVRICGELPRIQLSPCIETVKVEKCVEHEEIAANGLAAPHRVIAKQDDMTLRQRDVYHHWPLRNVGPVEQAGRQQFPLVGETNYYARP